MRDTRRTARNDSSGRRELPSTMRLRRSSRQSWPSLMPWPAASGQRKPRCHEQLEATQRIAACAFRASRLAAKFQIARHSVLALCLRLIPRAAKSGPRLAPVIGSLSGPVEIRRANKALECPGRIVRNVGGEAKPASRPQYARKHQDRAILHEPPLPMPTLRPRIRVEQIDLDE